MGQGTGLGIPVRGSATLGGPGVPSRPEEGWSQGSRPRPHLVLLAATLLVVLEDVVTHVVLGVDEQLLRVALLLPPPHPQDKEQDQGCGGGARRERAVRASVGAPCAQARAWAARASVGARRARVHSVNLGVPRACVSMCARRVDTHVCVSVQACAYLCTWAAHVSVPECVRVLPRVSGPLSYGPV